MQQYVETKWKYKVVTCRNLTRVFWDMDNHIYIYNLYYVLSHKIDKEIILKDVEKLSPKSYKFKELLSLHYYPILIFFFLSFFLSYKLNYCSAGFSVEPFNREDREQDLVSRTSESHDFLRNYKKYRMIRTCAFSCMRRNGTAK